MTKYQKIFGLWTLGFIYHLDFGIWILNPGFTRFVLYYEKTPKEYQKIYSQGEGAHPPRSFGFEGTGKINSKTL